MSTSYSGGYLFRGLKFADSGQTAAAYVGYQLSPNVGVKASYWLWTSYEPGQGSSTTTDLAVKYTPAGTPVALTAGWIYYGGQIHGRVRELYGSATATALPAQPTLTVYYGYTAPVHTVVVGSAGHGWSVAKRTKYVAWGAVGFNVGRNYAPDGFAVGILGNTLSYDLGKGFGVAATLDLHLPSSQYNNSLRLVPGAQISYGTTF